MRSKKSRARGAGVRSFDSAPDGASLRISPAGLPLGVASLMPANRLKFKSARPDHSFSLFRSFNFDLDFVLPTASSPRTQRSRTEAEGQRKSLGP